jgi:hypothetical protein
LVKEEILKTVTALQLVEIEQERAKLNFGIIVITIKNVRIKMVLLIYSP